MRKIALLLLLCITVLLPLWAKDVALLIGVGNIPSAKLNTSKDIQTIKSLLGNQYDEVIVLEDDEATYDNVKSALEKFYTLRRNDTLFFYYTGHGCQAWGDAREKDGKDEFLMLSGITYKNKKPEIYSGTSKNKRELTPFVDQKDNSVIIQSGIMLDDELNYHFSHIKAKKVILFDCCHSETAYKDLSSSASHAKTIGKGALFTLGYDAKKSAFENAKINNFIKLSACLDDEQTEDSDNGGIFTLALQKALKEQGNTSFSHLIQNIAGNLRPVAKLNHRDGVNTPNMDNKGIDASGLYTKDIFVVAKPVQKLETLEDYLMSRYDTDSRMNFYELGRQKVFTPPDMPRLRAEVPKSATYLYLLEIDGDHYKKLAATTISQCIGKGNIRECVFDDTVSAAPFGEAKIFLVATPNPLNIEVDNYKKDFKETLTSQLLNVNFDVGHIALDIVAPR